MSHTDELSQLAELHRNGDLTDEEFMLAKRKLLGIPASSSSPIEDQSESINEEEESRSTDREYESESIAGVPPAAAFDELLEDKSSTSLPEKEKTGAKSFFYNGWVIAGIGLIILALIAHFGKDDSPTSSPIQSPSVPSPSGNQPNYTTQAPAQNEPTVPVAPSIVHIPGIGKSRSFFTEQFQSQGVNFTRENDDDGQENYVGFLGAERQCTIQLIGPSEDLKSVSVTIVLEMSDDQAVAATGSFMKSFAETVVAGGSDWFTKVMVHTRHGVTERKATKHFGKITGLVDMSDMGNGILIVILTFSRP